MTGKDITDAALDYAFAAGRHSANLEQLIEMQEAILAANKLTASLNAYSDAVQEVLDGRTGIDGTSGSGKGVDGTTRQRI